MKEERTQNEFTQLYDNEWFQIKDIRDFKLECCDCGLVHDIEWRITRSKKLLMKVAQNKKATIKARKEKN